MQLPRVKDDWPQALIMSMGTLFLLVGVSLEIIRFLDRRAQTVRDDSGASLAGFAAAHPGLLTLLFGLVLLLLGYFMPRKSAK